MGSPCSSLQRTDRSRSGSIQGIPNIPDDLKLVFLTAFEIDQRELVEMAAERSPFIDQSQSFSLFLGKPTPAILVRYYYRIIIVLLTQFAFRWTFSCEPGAPA